METVTTIIVLVMESPMLTTSQDKVTKLLSSILNAMYIIKAPVYPEGFNII